MSTDSFEHLFLEEIKDIRGVEQKISAALARLAKGDSVRELWNVLTQLLKTTELRVNRLEEIAQETVTTGNVVPMGSRHGRAVSSGPQLTAREAEVLQMIAESYANKQIAAALEISIKTVEKHRQHLMAKLDLHDAAGITRYAISTGLIELSA